MVEVWKLGQTDNLRKKYHIFMRELVDNKYLKSFENVKVLGEWFVFDYYVVIFQSITKNSQLKVYIIVENINRPVIPLDLQISKNSNGYIITKQNILKTLPKRLYQKLVKNGVFEKLETEQNKNNSTFSIHRLVLSLYTGCLNQKVHHINFCRNFNAIPNLINMIKPKHDKTHKLRRKDAILWGLKDQDKLKVKLFKPKKHTLAENLISEILKLRIVA